MLFSPFDQTVGIKGIGGQSFLQFFEVDTKHFGDRHHIAQRSAHFVFALPVLLRQRWQHGFYRATVSGIQLKGMPLNRGQFT